MTALDYYVEYKLNKVKPKFDKIYGKDKYNIQPTAVFPEHIENVAEVMTFEVYSVDTGSQIGNFTVINKPVIRRSINRTWIDVEVISVAEIKKLKT